MTTHLESSGLIEVERHGAVLLIILNRPEVRNAVNFEMSLAVEAAIDQLDGDDDLRVGIIAANGPAFCAGMDLKAFARGQRPSTDRRGFAGLTRIPPRKPLVAAVEGPAMGGGFEVVLACDIVVASTSASFGLPEVRRGVVAAGGGLFRLAERIPLNHAMQAILTGRPISAEQAAELGLVNELVAPGEARPVALELAQTIASNAPLSVTASKRIITESKDWPSDSAFTLQEPICEAVRTSADAQEGARAFAEKREPRWQGR